MLPVSGTRFRCPNSEMLPRARPLLPQHSPFAAAWTDLFQSMIAVSQKLRWRENGPGLGRDARIAYSSLLGRYMARAYLTGNEDVRVLVPLDEAKRWLQKTPYTG